MKLVSFTTNDSTNLDAMTKVIKAQKSWACLGVGTWLVGGSLTYKELRDMLIPFNPATLTVIAFDYENWATYGCSEDINNYLRNNSTYD